MAEGCAVTFLKSEKKPEAVRGLCGCPERRGRAETVSPWSDSPLRWIRVLPGSTLVMLVAGNGFRFLLGDEDPGL